MSTEDIRAIRREIQQLRSQMAGLESRARQTWTQPVSGATDADKTIIKVVQSAHGFAVGTVVRHNGTSYVKSQANTAANFVVSGIVWFVVGADVFILATAGYVNGLTGLTAGSTHYLDATTAGALTTTAPAIAVPIILADTTTSGVLQSFWAGGGGAAPTEDGTVFASDSTGLAGEWVRYLDLGRNAATKAGKLSILSPAAAGVAVEIDGSLVPAAGKKITIREIDVCDAGTAKKMLILGCAPY